MTFAKPPQPPYYAVIFTSQRCDTDRDAYERTAARMVELAALQAGFLGVETARGEDGFGITVSYWESEDAIAAWKANAEHLAAQDAGSKTWYAHYELRIARVERAYGK